MALSGLRIDRDRSYIKHKSISEATRADISVVKTCNSVDKLMQLRVIGELQVFQVNSAASDEHDFVILICTPASPLVT